MKKMNDDTIICRCEDVTLGDIKRLLEEGYETIDELKLKSRCGMGSCQGRTCRPLLIDIISDYKGIDKSKVKLSTFRPPTKPIQISTIIKSQD